MAFQRITQLDIGLNNNTGVRISNLNFTFELERSVEAENNYMRLSIYNAKRETRDKILIKDNSVFLQAGYEDEKNLGLIGAGIIQQSTTKLENTDYVTEITVLDFGSNQINIKKQKADFNFTAGTSYSSIVQYLGNIMNVPVTGLQNISSLLLNNGIVFHGTIIQLIRKLQKKLRAYNVGLYFDLGEMVIWKTDEMPTQFGVINLSPQSGLLGEVEEIIDDEDDGLKRIKFLSLMNPKIKPQTVIRIKSKKLTGAFIVQKVTFRGGNISTDEFIVEVEALS